MVVFIGFTIAQAVELRAIRKERDRADRITEFMTNMFKVSAPGQSRGNDIRVREILDNASTQIVNGLAKEPQDQARLMQVMGEVYENLASILRPSHSPDTLSRSNVRCLARVTVTL
jgi:eukaryotic-like serine/threonine-protein kinase